jgi:SWI/SNF-related matrix-associated actin-dependent regulator 1 of chromatin subfamily A
MKDFSKEKYELSKATALEKPLSVPAPEGLSYLPYQLAAVKYALLPPYRVLIADDMGLGKTIETAAVINYTAQPHLYVGHRFLIICPAYLKLNWREELKKWLARPFSIGIASSKKAFPDAKIVVINYEILHLFKKNLDGEVWELLALDEAHRLQSKDSRRTVMTFGGELKVKTSPKPKTGVQNARAEKFKPIRAMMTLALTGTPIYSRPLNLWTILNNLRPDIFNNFFNYACRYCAAKKNYFGWDFSGASNTKELGFRLRSTCMVRRVKKDVAAQLPDKIVKWSPFESNVKFMVKKRCKKGRHLAHLAEYRLQTGKAKIPYVYELAKNFLENIGLSRLIIFAYHRELVFELAEKFKEISVSLVGGETDKAKKKNLNKFQKGERPLLIGTMDCIGEGLNLQVCDTAIFAELDYSSEKLRQAEDRLLRIGQKNTVRIFYPRLLGSWDDLAFSILSGKQEHINNIIGD